MSSNSEFHARCSRSGPRTPNSLTPGHTTTLDFSSTAAIFILCRDMSRHRIADVCRDEPSGNVLSIKILRMIPFFSPTRIPALLRPAHDFDVPDHRVDTHSRTSSPSKP